MVAACVLETAGVKCGYLQSKLKASHNRKKCQEQTDSVKPEQLFVGHVIFSLGTLYTGNQSLLKISKCYFFFFFWHLSLSLLCSCDTSTLWTSSFTSMGLFFRCSSWQLLAALILSEPKFHPFIHPSICSHLSFSGTKVPIYTFL